MKDTMNMISDISKSIVGFLAGIPSAFVLYAVSLVLNTIYQGINKDKVYRAMLEITIIALTGVLAQSVLLAQGVALYFAVARLKQFLTFCKEKGVDIPAVVYKLVDEKDTTNKQ